MQQRTSHRADRANRRALEGFFAAPALRLDRAGYRPDRSLSLSPPERRDLARLDAIGRTPVLDRTPDDHAFEDAFEIASGWPSAVGAAIEGLLAGHRAAERRAGHPIALCLSVDSSELDTETAADVRAAIVRGAAS
ncbi:hypothetical protein [Rubrivirga sp.]|uniref:hypothetical protein n=1 Tax=Rubrivirga sp. TaxID=1885344 RepID=UPI003C71202F